MAEFYEIKVEGAGIAFALSDQKAPGYALAARFDPADAPAGLGIVCRMGAPDQFHCVIFREAGKPGGTFVLHEQGAVLFAAAAASELAYGLAKGFFGSLVANARYGVDIYEGESGDD